MDPISGILLIGAICTPIVLVGLLPTIIAFGRQHPNRWIIMAVNCFGGPFFGLGWVFGLIWAFNAFDLPTIESKRLDEKGVAVAVNDHGRVRLIYHQRIRRS